MSPSLSGALRHVDVILLRHWLAIAVNKGSQFYPCRPLGNVESAHIASLGKSINSELYGSVWVDTTLPVWVHMGRDCCLLGPILLVTAFYLLCFSILFTVLLFNSYTLFISK